MKITILDPALCCSTGVCGPDVDDALIQTSANVKWLKSLGHDVRRHNISNDGASFNEYPVAIDKLQQNGINSLPYILLNEELVLSGRYPEKAEWEAFISKSRKSEIPLSIKIQPVASDGSCCSGKGCC